MQPVDVLGRLPAFAPALALVLGAWCAASGQVSAAAAIGPGLLVVAARSVHARNSGIAVALAAAAFLLGAGLAVRSSAVDMRERILWLGRTHGYAEGHWRAVVLRSAEADSEGGRRLDLLGRPEDAAPGRPLRLGLRIPAGTAASIGDVDRLRAGDEVRVWCRFGLPVPYRNPGSRDPALDLRAAGIDAIGSVKSGRLLTRTGVARAGPGVVVDRLRREVRRRVERVAGSDRDVGAVLAALFLGERAGLRPAIRDGMADGGVVHVLAVSGLHVSILVGIVSAMLVPLPRTARRVLIVVAIVGFVTLVGPRASVVRAASLGLSALLARSIGRNGAGLQALALAAAGMTIARPLAPLDVGFQLSFSAVAAILGTARPLAGAIPLVPGPVRASLSISIAAYAGTLPILATRFHRATTSSVLANLVAVPACAATLTTGLAAVALLDVPVVGTLAAQAARTAVRLLLQAGTLGEVLGGRSTVAPPGGLTVFLYGCVWIALAARAGFGRGPGRIVPALCACAFLHLGVVPGSGEPAGTFLVDVGQGQALFASDGRGACVVVDAAGSWSRRFDPGERIVVPAMLRHGCRRIPILALSHEHEDHVGGARAVVRAFPVDELWIPTGSVDRGPFRAVAEIVRARGGAVVAARRETRRDLGWGRLEAVHPGRADLDLGTNDRSLVVRLEHGGTTLVIAGDLEAPGERTLLGTGADLAADILVVGHHGSRSSTTTPFLDAVGPREAWISAGRRNRFGHPDRAVVDRLLSRGIVVRRTDLDGRVAAFEP